MQRTELEKELRNYTYYCECIDDIMKEVEDLKRDVNSMRELSGIDYSRDSTGNTNKISDTVANTVIAIEKLSSVSIPRKMVKLDALYAKKDLVERLLLELDPLERKVITIRYIDRKTIRDVCHSVLYSRTQVYRICDRSFGIMVGYLARNKQ